jgi:hypothetical protein
MIDWFEWDKQEPEAGGPVDWTATRSEPVAKHFAAALSEWLTFAPGGCD